MEVIIKKGRTYQDKENKNKKEKTKNAETGPEGKEAGGGALEPHANKTPFHLGRGGGGGRGGAGGGAGGGGGACWCWCC